VMGDSVGDRKDSGGEKPEQNRVYFCFHNSDLLTCPSSDVPPTADLP
jgi:hypothetical protein